MPRVSVIIPNYNHARFLAQRVDSVLNQTFTDFDVLFMDDASSDQSLSVFARYLPNPRIRSLYNQQNTGNTFIQWQRGLAATQGEYIWIAESDDAASPKLLQTLVNALDANPTCGMAYCQSLEMDSHGSIGPSMLWLTEQIDAQRWRHDFVNNGCDEVANYLVLRNTIPNASGVLFRRSAFDQIGGPSTHLRLCGDWLTYARMLLASDIAFVAEPLNYFRTHRGSVRSKSLKFGLETEEIYRVLHYLSRHAHIESLAMQRAIGHAANRWLAEMHQMPYPWARIITIYRIANALDPHINRTMWERNIRPFFTRRLRLACATLGSSVRRVAHLGQAQVDPELDDHALNTSNDRIAGIVKVLGQPATRTPNLTRSRDAA